jgi:hypothetical protein
MMNAADLAPSADSVRVDISEFQPPWPDNPASSETKTDESVDNSVESCPICLDEISDSDQRHITSCGHSFHSSCMAAANMITRPNNRCPLCRQPLEPAGDIDFRQTGEIAIRSFRCKFTMTSVGIFIALVLCLFVSGLGYFLGRKVVTRNLDTIRCSAADLKVNGLPTGVIFSGVLSYTNGQTISYCNQAHDNCAQGCEYVCKVGWGHLKAIRESLFVPSNVSSQFIQPCVWCEDLGMWSPGGNISADGRSSFPQPCHPCKKCLLGESVATPCTSFRDTVCQAKSLRSTHSADLGFPAQFYMPKPT